jgi:DNA modification methylase
MGRPESVGEPVPQQTHHLLCQADARALPLPDSSIQLVVTSPPYPMIAMWDEVFTSMNPEIGRVLDAGDGWAAFDEMHKLLESAWEELVRVLAPGGIVCVNVGDATRTIEGDFRRYPNHERISQALIELGLRPLPDLLWHKPTNGPTKFMGSMRPPNGYVTLEHEYIMPFRKGGPRTLDSDRRGPSSYFWEERNRWFSDVWTITGERQSTPEDTRERAGAFPTEIPYRLINMFSVQGDTILDPFCGTGTTSVAAAATARHSVGCDVDRDLLGIAASRHQQSAKLATERGRERLEQHENFVAERRRSGDHPDVESRHYDTRVVTKREREIAVPSVESVSSDGGSWVATHGVLDLQ